MQVLEYAEDMGMRGSILRYDPLQGIERQLSLLETAMEKGSWFVVDQLEIHTEAANTIAKHILPKPATALHDSFRTFFVGHPDAARGLSVMVQTGLVALHSPLRDSIACRRLAVAVEEENGYLVQNLRQHICLLDPSDQVELFRRCRSEGTMLNLLEGEEEEMQGYGFVHTAKTEWGERLLDVAIRMDFKAAAARLRDLGAISEVMDLDLLLEPRFHEMLETLCHPLKIFPFEPLKSVHKAAAHGNMKVLKMLFDARVDRDFRYEDYPLVLIFDHPDTTQLIIDRMEQVGLHPFRDASISLHFFMKIFDPVPRKEESPFTALNDAAVGIVSRLLDCILEDGAPPYAFPTEFVDDMLEYDRSSPLIPKMLEILDVTVDSGKALTYFLEYQPSHPQAKEALVHHMKTVLDDESKGRLTRSNQIVRRLIRAGPSVIHLLDTALRYTGVTYKLPLAGPNGEEYMRTPLMQSFELPGFPEAAGVILSHDSHPNEVDERGMNVLQQAVWGLVHNPLPYIEHVHNYAVLFSQVVTAGVDTVAEQPDFSISLFEYCARYDLGPLCYELLRAKPYLNVFMVCNENLLSGMLNYSRYSASGAPPEEVMDKRIVEAKRMDEWDPSLVVLPDFAVLNIMSFLPAESLIGVGYTCARFYSLSLSDDLWRGLAAREGVHLDILGEKYTPVSSAKLVYRCECRSYKWNRWVRLPAEAEEAYGCIYTRRVVSTKPTGEVVSSSTRC